MTNLVRRLGGDVQMRHLLSTYRILAVKRVYKVWDLTYYSICDFPGH